MGSSPAAEAEREGGRQNEEQPRLRAVLLGLALAAFLGLATPYSDLFLQDSRLGVSHLPLGPLGILFVMVAGYNWVAQRAFPAWAWRRTELLLIYCMLLATVALASTGYGGWVLQVSAAPFYFAHPGNKWEELFLKYLPNWLHPPNRGYVIRALFEGLARGQEIPWRAWLVPIGAWTLFATLLFVGFGCWAVILSRRWIESEKLVFPLTQVPLSLVGGEARPPGRSSVLRNRLMWLGFAVPAVVHTFNSLGVYFQGIPRITLTDIDIGSGFTMRPWDALSGLRIYVVFSIIGVAYLLTAEISLSMWVFYWVHLAQLVAFRALGIGEAKTWWASADPENNQEESAFFVLVFFMLWAARGELKETFLAAVKRGFWKRAEETEPLPFAVAVVGMVVCFAGMVGWLSAAGAKPALATFFLLTFVVMATTLARLVNAGGAIFVEASWLPQDIAINIMGTKPIGARTLTVMAMPERIFMFNQETILMPYLMDGLKIAHTGGIEGRRLAPAVFGAFLITILCANYMVLRLGYEHGGLALKAGAFSTAACWPYQRLAGNLNNPSGVQWPDLFFNAVGAAFMALLIFLQRRFLWWPVHPLGFVMASTGTARAIWFSFMLGWLAKSVVQRYGGYWAYRRLVPVALGLILGEYMVSAGFTVLDAVLGKTGHEIFPAL